MNNLPLQPLKWFDCKYGTGADTVTVICEYDIYKYGDERIRHEEEITSGENSLDSWVVAYYNRHTEAPTKEATGFSTIDEAKAWAWSHYNKKMQPYVKPDSISACFDNFTQWSYERKVIKNGNKLAQGLKLVSEVGELADNLAKGRDIKDDIGDCMVVLNNLAHMTDTPLIDCLAQAWNDIKDRKGHMNENGVFIKEGDSGITPIKSLACLDGTILGE